MPQLEAAGLDRDRVHYRARTGRLHRIHRGVYAVGHRGLSNQGRWMAAVLACGEGAVLSHRSAAALWGLLAVPSGPVDVTIPASAGRKNRQGIRLRRSPSVISASTRRSGIPVTTPDRTIADLRSNVPAHQLRRAIREAGVLGLSLNDAVEPVPTRSELEHQFLRLCRRHRLPLPEVNPRVGRYEVDFLWRDQALIAETDGYRYHRGRQAFEEDRARDLELRLLGYDVLRFTHRQLSRDPGEVATALRSFLSASRRTP